jgi:hypothetical protein
MMTMSAARVISGPFKLRNNWYLLCSDHSKGNFDDLKGNFGDMSLENQLEMLKQCDFLLSSSTSSHTKDILTNCQNLFIRNTNILKGKSFARSNFDHIL